MDISKLKPSDWIMAAAGLVMLIFGMVLDWAKIEAFGVEASGNGPFDYFFTGGISWLLVVAVGVLAFLVASGVMKSDGVPWPLVFVLASALATLLMLFRLILGGGEEAGIDLDRGVGMFVAFIAAVGSLVGAVMGFKASGGDLNDLKDFGKIKGAFDKGGEPGAAPPPPPPPPPPPTV